MKSPKRENVPKKKNFLKNHARKKSDEMDADYVEKNPDRLAAGGDRRNNNRSNVEPQVGRLICFFCQIQLSFPFHIFVALKCFVNRNKNL